MNAEHMNTVTTPSIGADHLPSLADCVDAFLASAYAERAERTQQEETAPTGEIYHEVYEGWNVHIDNCSNQYDFAHVAELFHIEKGTYVRLKAQWAVDALSAARYYIDGRFEMLSRSNLRRAGVR